MVEGALGRVGRAFVPRLAADGFRVHSIDRHNRDGMCVDIPAGDELYLFDCAFDRAEVGEHLQRALHAMSQHRHYAGIFVPSSFWIADGTPYGQAKLVIEQAAHVYRLLGANIVTDRIGYFPGEGVRPDPRDPFFDKLVDADTLYARVMEKLL